MPAKIEIYRGHILEEATVCAWDLLKQAPEETKNKNWIGLDQWFLPSYKEGAGPRYTSLRQARSHVDFLIKNNALPDLESSLNQEATELIQDAPGL